MCQSTQGDSQGLHSVDAGRAAPREHNSGVLRVLLAPRPIVGAGEEISSLLAHLLHQPGQALPPICGEHCHQCLSNIE